MWLNLFANCLPVKGFSRSMIYDLQMQSYFFIPNLIFDEFKYGQNKLSEEKIKYLPKDYIDLLKEKNVVFETTEPELFPQIDFAYNCSSLITNTIVDVHDNMNHDLLVQSLNNFNCSALLLKFDDKYSIEDLRCVLNNYSDTKLIMVKCYFYWNKTNNKEDLISLYNEFPFSSFVVYNAPEDIMHEFKDILVIQFEKICNYNENVYPWLFNVNMDLFSESQMYHSYFNRKLYIGSKGEIKNGPLNNEIFGYLQDVENVEEFKWIIESPDFRKFWFAKKDATDVCKDCENRYMCVDPRIPILKENGGFYHEKFCLYNPYICKWSGEDGYVSTEECGNYSNENGFVIDETKIEELNKKIWGE